MAARNLLPVEQVRKDNPTLADAFIALRNAAVSGPLDETTCELILLAALATTGDEGSFKVHARRLSKLGADPSAMRQAVSSTLAATSRFGQMVSALRWIDQVLDQDAGA